MPNVKEIRALKQSLIEYHTNRVKQQNNDDSYKNDAFAIDFLPEKVRQIKTGKAYRMVSSPAEHIITSNPQVFRPPKGNATEAASRMAIELNRWVNILLRQNPQPFKEYVKKLLGKGEAWTYWRPNDHYDPTSLTSLPFFLDIPDPTIMYVDDECGEVNGVPNRLMVMFEREARNIKRNYPQWVWTNQKGRKDATKIPFFMYWDNETRFFDADGDALLGFTGKEEKFELANGTGIQENVLGFVPFTHSYSGFGEADPDGDPKHLAVGRITKIKGLIDEYTAIRSVIDDLTFKYSHPPMDLLYDPTVGTPSKDIGQEYDRSPGAFNTVPILGSQGALKKGVDLLPDAQLFNYLFKIDADIQQEDPLALVGQALGTSGRQDDIAQTASLRRYDTVVENTAHSFATGLGLVMRMIDKVPMLKPSNIRKTDINGYYTCAIELKAEDPIDLDRLRTLGSRLWQAGEIDLKTNLITYQGYDEEEADNIIAARLVDNVTLNNPIIAQLMGQQLAKEAGFDQEFAALQALEEGQTPQNQQAARPSEVVTETGREQSDMSLVQGGQRRAPSG